MWILGGVPLNETGNCVAQLSEQVRLETPNEVAAIEEREAVVAVS